MAQIITVYDRKKRKKKYVRKLDNRTWLTSYDVKPLLNFNFKLAIFVLCFALLFTATAGASLTSNKIAFFKENVVYLLDKNANTTINATFSEVTQIYSIKASTDGNNYIIVTGTNGKTRTYNSDLATLNTITPTDTTLVSCDRYGNYYYCGVYHDAADTAYYYIYQYGTDGLLKQTSPYVAYRSSGAFVGGSVVTAGNNFIYGGSLVDPASTDSRFVTLNSSWESIQNLSSNDFLGTTLRFPRTEELVYATYQRQIGLIFSASSNYYSLFANGTVNSSVGTYTPSYANYMKLTTFGSQLTHNATGIYEWDGVSLYTYPFSLTGNVSASNVIEYSLVGSSTTGTGANTYSFLFGKGSDACGGIIEAATGTCSLTGTSTSVSCSQTVIETEVNITGSTDVMFTSASSTAIANLQNATQIINGGGYAAFQPFNLVQNTTGSAKALVTYSTDFVNAHIGAQDDYLLTQSRLSQVLGVQSLLNVSYGGWFGYFESTAPCLGTWKRAAYVGYNSSHVEIFAFRCEANNALYAYDGLILPKNDSAVPAYLSVNETTTSSSTYIYLEQTFGNDSTAAFANPFLIILRGAKTGTEYDVSGDCVNVLSDDDTLNYSCVSDGITYTGTANANEDTYIYTPATGADVSFNIITGVSDSPSDYSCRYRGSVITPDASGICSYSNVPLYFNSTFYLTGNGKTVNLFASTNDDLNSLGVPPPKCSGEYVYEVDVSGSQEIKNLRIYVLDPYEQSVSGVNVSFGGDGCTTKTDGTCVLYGYLLDNFIDYPIYFESEEYGSWSDYLIDNNIGTLNNGAYDFIFYVPEGQIASGSNAFQAFESILSIGNIILFLGLLVCLALAKFAGGQVGMLAGAIWVIWASGTGLLPTWLGLLVVIVVAALAAYKISGRDTGG